MAQPKRRWSKARTHKKRVDKFEKNVYNRIV